jgi:hypothetical protein
MGKPRMTLRIRYTLKLRTLCWVLRLHARHQLAHNVEAKTRAYEIRMRAARKAGELSKRIDKAQGTRSD